MMASLIRVGFFGLCLFLSLGAFSQSGEILCNDGKDNDGDGQIDCNDTDCQFAANIEKGCRCYDSGDNDGDGKIDQADPDCATYYGLTFVGQGSNCSIVPPGASTPFDLVGNPTVSGQNTSDTQSKVAVGDIDGDGIPDAIITSKWNSEVRVVATTAHTVSGTSYAPGDIKSDFKTTGQGAAIFPNPPGNGDPCEPSNLLFEHEVLIADIDKDKTGEIFCVISNRKGNPESPPTCYFLLAFRYTKDDLTVLPGYPVRIGTDRPGTPGIADFDGDGKAEIYLKNRIYAAENGTLLADPGGNWDSEINSAPVAVNMTGDNTMELVCGNLIYSVPSLASRTPQTLTLFRDMNTIGATKSYPRVFDDLTEYGLDNHSSTSVADIDEDGFIDVLISGSTIKYPAPQNTAVFYWNVQKGIISSYLPPDNSLPTPYVDGWPWGTGRINIGDSDGDNDVEASFIAGSQLFNMEFAAGNRETLVSPPKWIRTINDSRSGILTVTIYDFNNDANPEMVYRDSQELVVIDGLTGTNKQWSAVCQSHTYTEGPIIADVNGDGGTDICVPCYRNNSFNINSGLQQQALGEVRLFFSSANEWLPTRKVWNQPGYFVVNINDDLSLPFPQLDQNMIFGTAACPNGLPGPQMPLNIFLNQIPNVSASGCPVFPAPDLTYVGDTPSPACTANPTGPGCDTDGDGVYTPAVVVIPPICGNLGIQVYFNIQNTGDLPISDNVPVSFFNGDPTASPVTATRLHNTTIAINNLQVGATLQTPTISFNGPGTTFQLYILLYNDGSILPVNLAGSSTKECTISNNIYNVTVAPDPITITIEKLSDNFKCAAAAPDTGALRIHIFKGATEVTDYSPYSFQWYSGIGTGSPIPGATNYNITGIAEGDYTVVATEVAKGCTSNPISANIIRTGSNPTINLTLLSAQTTCSPPNGKVQADIVGGNTGYTFTWYDISLTPLGITGPVANNLSIGNYVVLVQTTDGCPPTASAPITVPGPQFPDAQASVLQHVVDCSNLNSGSITADALTAGVVQPPAGYTFDWYFYNNATSTRGSILPPANGTGQTRTGLAVGYYQVEVKDNATQCVSPQSPVVQVTSQTVIPDPPLITELAPQTSCDAAQPNGVLKADAVVGGVVQNPAGFTFEWFKGQNTLPANLVSTVSGVNGQQVNQVAGGGIPYTVRVTTALNCSSTGDLVITENVNLPVVTLTQLTPNTVCDAAKATAPYNGSLTTTVTFGGSNVPLPDNQYVFTWYDGPTVLDPVIAVADNKNPVLAGLQDGSYTLMVERVDLFCKSVPQTTPVARAVVLPALATSSTGSNNCDPLLTADGTVSVAVTNVIAGDVFGYQWYDGNAVLAGAELSIPVNQADQSTAIRVGGPTGAPKPYTVMVSNLTTGCENSSTQFVADNSVIPVLSYTSIVPNTICAPAASFNGSLTVQVDNQIGVIADYIFTWYNGPNTGSPVNPSSTGISLGQLDVGFYTVEVENTKTGCESSPITNQVPNGKIFPALLPAATGSNNCDPLLTPDGTATVSVTNAAGGATFSYQWHTGVAVVPANALGPVNTGTSVTATKLGGPVGAPHPYTVLVTDNATGCDNFTTVFVADNSVVPVLSFTLVAPNTICSPATSFTGSLTTQVDNLIGVIGDYVFKWYDGNSNGAPVNGTSTGPTLAQLDAGFYTVDVRNSLTGCQSAPITNQVPDGKVIPIIQINSTGSNNCDPLKTPDGTITATITNAGVGDTFSYSWSAVAPAAPINVATNQANQSTAIRLGGPTNAPNSYDVVVTNTATGCQNNSTGMVADISAKPTFTLTPGDNTICDVTVPGGPTVFNGQILASAVTHPAIGTSNITYSWFNVDPVTLAITGPNVSSTGPLLDELDNGKYALTVTIDDLGCTSDPVTDEVLDALTPIVPVTNVNPSTNCAPVAPNGLAEVTAPLGANFTYEWYDGATVDPLQLRAETTPLLGNTIQGTSTFTVRVTNLNDGCRGNAPMTVVDAKVIPTLALSVVQDNTICDQVTIDPDGELLATVGLVAPNYSITWLGGVAPAAVAGANGEQFTKLRAGSYTANVIDDDTGCQSADDIISIVDDLLFPVVAVTVTDQTSCNVAAPNGALAATGDGGTNTVTHDFVWHDGIGTGGAVHPQNGTGIIDGLDSDDYTVEVTIIATGCATTASAFVPNNIVNPSLNYAAVNPVTVCGPIPSGLSPNGTATAVLTDISALPATNFTVYYVRTVQIGPVGVGSYPTDPLIVKASPDTYSGGANPPPLTDLAPGYLTAMVVDNNTTCESAPQTVQIVDATAQYSFQINGVATAGLCSIIAPGGNIDLTVNRNGVPCVTCSYEWYDGTPVNQNINFFNNPPDMTGSTLLTTDEDLGVVNPVGGVSAGDYTLIVDDNSNGCGAYHVELIPTANPPTIMITQVDPTMCVNAGNPTNNGSISVQVTRAATNVLGYTANIYSGNAAVPANLITTSNLTVLSPFTLTANLLDNGDYFIEVVDEDAVNKPCPSGFQRTLTSNAFNPVVTINQIDPNTSCDPSNAADGAVTLTVTKDALDTSVPDYYITALNPLPVGFVLPGAPGFPVGPSGSSVGPADGLTGFEPIAQVPSYTITVTDDVSKCFKSVVVSVPDQVDLPSAFAVTPSPETLCAPGSDGSALASVAPDPSTEYDFEWYADNALAAIVNDGIANPKPGDGAGTGGELLNSTKVIAPAVWNIGAAGQGSGDKIFYVRGKKNATAATGVGCYTQVVQVEIDDQHVSPDMVLTPAFNSFCAAVAGGAPGDGSISIVADADPAAGGAQNAAGGFNYSWTNPNAALASPQNGQSNIFAIPQLGTGAYTVTAINATNGCSVVNASTINPAPFIVEVNTNTVTDQRICDPDGNITLTQITVDRTAAGLGNIVETSATPLTTNYDFIWYKAAPATPGTFDATPGQELQDVSAATVINSPTLGIDIDKVDEAGEFETMGAGTYYVIATRKGAAAVAAGCPSLPYRVDVSDVHQSPVGQLTPFSNTSCLPGSDEGEIRIVVNDATLPPFGPAFTYTYTWAGGNPTPIPAGAPGASDGDGDGTDGDEDRPIQLLEGVYNMTIRNNQSGCLAAATTEIFKNATPVFVQSVTVVDQVLCAADGSLQVASVTLKDRTGADQFSGVDFPMADFQFEWTRGAIAFTQITPGTTLNSGNYDATGAGFGVPIGAASYTVTARRINGVPGAGCASAPFKADIFDKRIFPVATLTPFANTSCDAAFFEGAISVEVTDNSTAVGAPGFTYTWSGANPTAIAAAAFPAPNNGDGLGPDEDNPNGLREGTYNMTVQSNKSLCVSNATTTIFKNSTPVFTQLVTATDQLLCGNDGALLVNEVRVIDRNGVTLSSLVDFPLADFAFTYDRGAIGNTVPGAITAPQLDVTNYPAIGFDSYFVVATRTSGGPGLNCSSAPYKVDILDKRILPVATLTPLSNTSCDPLFFEGAITVEVADNTSVPGPFTFTYAWDNLGNPTVINTLAPGANDGDGVGADGDEDNPMSLSHGVYTLTVTNNQSRCSSQAVTEIFQNATPIIIPAVASLPQVLCSPDGSLQVNLVSVTDRNGNTVNPVLAEFDFAWSRTTLANVVANTTGSLGAVPGGTILDNSVYATIGFDSYFVVATRVNGSPGRGCSSAPFKVDVEDKRLFPDVSFTSIANSSCSALKPNGSVAAAAAEQNGSNVGPYTFTWTLNGGALAPSSTQTDNANSSTIGLALDGTYVVTATNTVTSCPISESFNLLLDQVRSTPNIIDVSTVDPVNCLPSASAQVTKITLGSTSNSMLFPPSIPPNNDITGPGLAAFVYSWFSGTPANQIPGVTTPAINNLVSGTYFVSVLDPSTDCQSGPKELVISDLNIVYPVVDIVQTAKQISCTAVGTAALLATGDGQDDTNPDYNFEWYPTLDNTGAILATTSTASNLTIGNFSVKVTRISTGCPGSAAFIIRDDSPLYAPVASLSGQPRTLCVGTDGAVLARVLNIPPDYPFPYNYTADGYNGATPNLAAPPDYPAMPNVPGFNTNFTQTNLIEGVYTVRITDNNTGCFGLATETVEDKRVLPVVVVMLENPLTNCDPARPNGQLSATADGKELGYSFQWYAGAAVTQPPGPQLSATNKLIGVGVGTYIVRATHNLTGCATDMSAPVTDQHITPPIPTPEVIFHRTHCINPNGWVTATVDGTTFNYTFNWYDGTTATPPADFTSPDYQFLDIGNYTVTATDDVTGCVSPPATVEVEDRRVIPEFTIVATPSFCIDTGVPKGNGSVILELTDPSVVLEDVQWFDINSGANVGMGSALYELFPGLYRADAVTTEGCRNQGDVEVPTEIAPYNGISNDNDGLNETFIVDCISNFPNNNVKIFNRNGILVFEADGYNNFDIAFRGTGERGVYLQGVQLPVGTYFYIIDKRDGSKAVAGYLELDR